MVQSEFKDALANLANQYQKNYVGVLHRLSVTDTNLETLMAVDHTTPIQDLIQKLNEVNNH